MLNFFFEGGGIGQKRMTTSLALLFYFSIYFSFIVWERVWEWSVTLSGMWGAISWGVQTFPPSIFCRNTKNNWSCLDQHGWQNWRGKTKSDTVWGKSVGRALMQTRLVSSFHTAVNNRWTSRVSWTPESDLQLGEGWAKTARKEIWGSAAAHIQAISWCLSMWSQFLRNLKVATDNKVPFQCTWSM